MTRKIQIPLLLALLALVSWYLWPRNDAGQAPRSLPTVPEPVVPEPTDRPAAPVPMVERDPQQETKSVQQERSVEVPARPPSDRVAPLLQLIPDWLRREGDVRQDRVQVSGRSVDRVRSRLTWPNDSLVEVEVTDLGAGATKAMFESLGFDFELVDEDEDGQIRFSDDREDYVSNLEYDEDDASGHVQFIVKGRYLMEIQLENLPVESFQALEDRDGLFTALLRLSAEK